MNATQAGVTREEGTSFEKMLPLDRAVGKTVGRFLN